MQHSCQSCGTESSALLLKSKRAEELVGFEFETKFDQFSTGSRCIATSLSVNKGKKATTLLIGNSLKP